jgi:oligoribonuclease NrnB/cAMP/cGMP phosphodiesterase (DHH superfamily)
MNMPKLVISHSPCPDGFTAAWAVWLKFPDAEFVKGIYGQAPPDVTDREVIMVDFSYKRDVMMKLMAEAKRIVVLDHHKTAEAELEGLDTLDAKANVYIHFDMNKSGARLAWEYFHEGVEAPTIVKYVEDRDLWRFTLEWSNEVNAYILSYPYDFAVWTKIATEIADGQAGLQYAATQGAAINRKQSRDIAEIVDMTKRRAVIGGYEVWCANMPYTMASQAAHIMGKDEPFAATYYRRKDGKYVYSLRSSEEGIDVSEIASRYGGGGHKHAAGFETFGELR